MVEESDATAEFDYESVQVALYHLIENAAKYTAENSTLDVSFPSREGARCILLDMVSLAMDDDEFGRIFDDGYSGEAAKRLKRNGEGVGLGIIEPILTLNDAALVVRRDVGTQRRREMNFASYQGNQFEIQFAHKESLKES